MNWTGGRLQQSRRSGSAANAKQRAHFAKARARLQSGYIVPPPPHFAILEEYQPGYRSSPGKSHGNITSSPARILQTKLDEYPNVAPTVRRLASMNSHHDSVRRSPDPGRQSHRPLSRNSSVKTEIEYDEAWLQAKRLELLRRPNWLAVPIAKPLKITFASFEERQMIGRRRKLDENTSKQNAKRIRTGDHKDDLVVSQRLRTDRRPLCQKDFHSDAVSVRIGTSIHGSQRTVRQPLNQGDYASHHDSTGEARNVHSSNAPSSVIEVLDDGTHASSSVFEPLESSIFEPLESGADASSSVIEILDDGLQSTSQSTDQRDQLPRITPLGTSDSSSGDCRAETGTTEELPGSLQHHVSMSQGQTRAEAIVSPAFLSNSASHQIGRLIFPTSPLRLHAPSNVVATVKTNSILPSDRSISAQASNFEVKFEHDTDEEEWRGFMDLEMSSDEVLGPGFSNSFDTESVNPAQGLIQNNEAMELSNTPILDANDFKEAITKPIWSDTLTKLSVATCPDVFEDTVSRDTRTSKQKVEEDENSAWYRFVFGDNTEVDEDDMAQNRNCFQKVLPWTL
ncbi:hypothetical protein MMC11_001301 [Xylographa trunciseda]|nr:hypothetical protein [Xylographa trunciseda]